MWQVGGGAAIAGILLDPRSQPLAGVEIWLARATAQSGTEPVDKYFWHGAIEKPFETARTDAEGRFTFTNVESGDWWVGPGAVPLADDAPEEKSIATRAVGVRIPPESSDIEVVLRAHLGAFLRGRVLGPDGEAVEYAFVHAVPENAAGILSTRCGEDGSFALGPVAPGSFRVQAGGREGSADSDPVTARAGDKGIVLKLQTGGVLRGTLLGDEAGPPLSAQLLLCSHDEPQRCLRASAGRDATFEFTGVRGGTYDLVARSGDGRVGVVRGLTLASGGENRSVTVSLLPGARLGVRYLGASAWGRFTVLAGTTVIASESVQSGTVSWVGVPEGKLVVRFSAGGFTEERAVEASSARGETEVVFRSE